MFRLLFKTIHLKVYFFRTTFHNLEFTSLVMFRKNAMTGSVEVTC